MPSMLRECGLATSAGVGQVLSWAAAADPEAALCLNEWGALEGANWQGLVEMAAALKAAGAPLHCLGVQVRCFLWVSVWHMRAQTHAHECMLTNNNT
jgi:GH35 family endo-1,4-beta-xylanase